MSRFADEALEIKEKIRKEKMRQKTMKNCDMLKEKMRRKHRNTVDTQQHDTSVFYLEKY